ncbi:MAG: aminodeoxychorismate synthase component I [Firmicutes bacterium]|nr:aminodeoxychorismate synthase component I [Bacillota bacterium]
MILMIDNYDSFTYNLVQYLAEMEEEVQTYRNDELGLSDIYDLRPEMLVISPGPCTPNEAGISLEIIREFGGRIPLLGVCLGHQAIGQVFGAEVTRARKPVHGKTSSIAHDGKTIYRGLKNPLTVCRYHSLSLNPASIPSCLEVTAWTEDGEIMGIRHRQYLVEGVQFHPEAVLTEGGKQLLRNFIKIARAFNGGRRKPEHRFTRVFDDERESNDDPRSLKDPASLDALVQPVETSLDAFEIFLLFKDEPYSFFLDSGMDREKLGRYSFIGSRPFLVFKSQGRQVEILRGAERVELQGNPLDLLGDYYQRYKVQNRTSLPFVGGMVGYFGYDLNLQIERLPSVNPDDVGIPDCLLGFYDSVIIFDHRENRVYMAATGLPETDRAKALLNAEEKINDLKLRIEKASSGDVEFPDTPQEGIWLASNFTREAYCRAVQRAIDYIYAGDIYQVNLSQRFAGEFAADPVGLYRRLRDINPAPFAAFLNFREVAVIGSSPERFLKLADGVVETRPIKGTRPRGRTPEEDQALRDELINSVKDRAELVMIVDLERNDLGRVCEPGSVQVTELFTLEEYATVYHLVATITGRLKEDKDAIDLLKASFPGGSITGAPKIRSMEIIEELEPTRRNIYTGSIGYLGFDGDADLNIVIRTIMIKDHKAYFQVGGGIVADSVPEKEYQETLDKAKALIRALKGRFFPE